MYVNNSAPLALSSFSRLIEGVDPCPQDLPLDQSYYLEFGVGDRGRGKAILSVNYFTSLLFFPDNVSVSRFHRHEQNPQISSREYNLATQSGEIGRDTLKRDLITAHAVLMLVAWPLLAFTGIFFAAWMRPALPNGQWFQVHIIMLNTLWLVVVLSSCIVLVRITGALLNTGNVLCGCAM